MSPESPAPREPGIQMTGALPCVKIQEIFPSGLANLVNKFVHDLQLPRDIFPVFSTKVGLISIYELVFHYQDTLETKFTLRKLLLDNFRKTKYIIIYIIEFFT